ncbi:MAG: radical SAM protein [Desulfomonilaceae bacterium]|nr:radical SAM protein [Desulfomonilaceae bacterium]
MEFMDRIKTMSREQAARAMVELLTVVSPDTFLKMALLASRLIEGERAGSAVEAVRLSLLEGEDSQASRLFKRVMTDLSPHCLKKVANTLFINGLLKSSALRRDFEAKNGFSPPFTILISPTMQCNLQCVGCYSGRYAPGKGLSRELIDRVLNEAKAMGIRFIVFSGGEPLTRKNDLFPLIERHGDMYFMFYTNGTLIDDTVADKLYKVGNAGAVMSLEGFEEATDLRRGRGVYRQVMDAMDRLSERGVPFGTSLTVTSRNVEHLTSDEFFEHLYSKGVMIAWLFLFMPVGKDPDVSLMPSPEQREYLRRRGIALREKFPIFIADFWNDAPFVGGCIAGGTNYVHINANGDVEPCVFTHMAADSIMNKSLTEVLNSEFFRMIRSKQPYSVNLLTPCMIIDNPDVFRDVSRRCCAYPTHDGAEDVFLKIRDDLDDYGRRLRALYDPIWEREKAEYGYADSSGRTMNESRHATP